jgi:hypothetical protein
MMNIGRFYILADLRFKLTRNTRESKYYRASDSVRVTIPPGIFAGRLSRVSYHWSLHITVDHERGFQRNVNAYSSGT